MPIAGPRRRLGLSALATLATLVSLWSVSAGPAAAGEGKDLTQAQREVQQLRTEVAVAADELAAGAARYEAAQNQLDTLRQLESAGAVDMEARARSLQSARARLNRLVRSTYQGASDPTLRAWLTADLAAVGDLRYLRGRLDGIADRQDAVVQDLVAQRSAAEVLLRQRSSARVQAQRAQEQLDAELSRLQQVTEQRRVELTARSVALAQAEAQRAAQQAVTQARAQAQGAVQAEARAVGRPGPAAGAAASASPGAACSGPADDVVNGFVPAAALCALSAAGQRLAFRAAPAFEAMTAAYAQRFGRPLCLTQGYRDYAGQVDVFRRTPSLAATPGRSQHGFGLAVDLCGGVQSFGSEQHAWMRANAGRFGFVPPAWASPGGSLPEPWHWEYRPGA